MIRWFLYSAVYFIVYILGKIVECYLKSENKFPVVVFIISVVSIVAFFHTLIFFFIGTSEVLSNFNFW